MGLLGRQVGHVPDRSNLPKGEYMLECTAAEDKVAKTGRNMVGMIFNFVEHPYAFPIFENVMMPREGDKSTTVAMFEEQIKNLKTAFGYGPDDDFESESLVGLQVPAVVKEVDSDNGPRNEIMYFSVSQAPTAAPTFQEEVDSGELDPDVTGQGENG